MVTNIFVLKYLSDFVTGLFRRKVAESKGTNIFNALETSKLTSRETEPGSTPMSKA